MNPSGPRGFVLLYVIALLALIVTALTLFGLMQHQQALSCRQAHVAAVRHNLAASGRAWAQAALERQTPADLVGSHDLDVSALAGTESRLRVTFQSAATDAAVPIDIEVHARYRGLGSRRSHHIQLAVSPPVAAQATTAGPAGNNDPTNPCKIYSYGAIKKTSEILGQMPRPGH